MSRTHFLVTAMVVALALAPSAAVAQVTWTGTAGTGDWATAGAFAGSSGGITLNSGFNQAFVFAGTPAIVKALNGGRMVPPHSLLRSLIDMVPLQLPVLSPIHHP